MKEISKQRLAQLLREEYKLICLEAAGVNYWELYDCALEEEIEGDPSYYSYKRLSDDEITKDYQDI